MPGHDARGATGLLGGARVAMTLAAIFIGHAIAERTSRRRVFAQFYAALMALAMLAPCCGRPGTACCFRRASAGVAMGVYAVIDLTLMSRVLPNPLTAGRDLALLVMAGATAQFIAPAIAGVTIDRFGYGALFLAAPGSPSRRAGWSDCCARCRSGCDGPAGNGASFQAVTVAAVVERVSV